MTTIRLIASTRQEPTPAALIGAEYTATVGGLIKAAHEQRSYLKIVRLHTDSAARVWIECDGRAIDADEILCCQSTREMRETAASILARIAQ